MYLNRFSILFLLLFITVFSGCEVEHRQELLDQNDNRLEASKANVRDVFGVITTAYDELNFAGVIPGEKGFEQAYATAITAKGVPFDAKDVISYEMQGEKSDNEFSRIIEQANSPEEMVTLFEGITLQRERTYLANPSEDNLDFAVKGYIVTEAVKFLLMSEGYLDTSYEGADIAKAWNWRCIGAVAAGAVTGALTGCKVGAEIGAYSTLSPQGALIGCGVVGVIGAVGGGLTAASIGC